MRKRRLAIGAAHPLPQWPHSGVAESRVDCQQMMCWCREPALLPHRPNSCILTAAPMQYCRGVSWLTGFKKYAAGPLSPAAAKESGRLLRA